MSKTKTALTWAKASDDLKAKVKHILGMRANNRYSTSRIYAAHNEVFGLSEAMQTCSTCLTSRASALQKWWDANADTESVPTTGEFHEAPKPEVQDDPLTYDEVVAKYGIAFDEESESETLKNFIDAGEANTAEGLTGGITADELGTLQGRFNELIAQQFNKDLQARVDAKLADLGINEDSTDEDYLEAYDLLAAIEGNPEDEAKQYFGMAAAFRAQVAAAAKLKGNDVIEGVQVINMGEGLMAMHFTAGDVDPAKGTIANADGTKPKAGTYTAADGQVIAVAVGGKATLK